MLNQAISSLRVGRGTVRRFRRAGSWGMRYSGLTGSGFHVVLRGAGWLVAADSPPVALQRGDVVLITSGADHGLSHTPRALHELPKVVLGLDEPYSGPADFEFLCGAYRLDRGQVHPYLAALPDLLVVSADQERFPAMRSVIDLLDNATFQERTGMEVARSAVLDLMLVHALRQWVEREGSEGSKGQPAFPDLAVATALHAIHNSPQTQWTVTQLGATVGMSRVAFTRRFTAIVGKPPMTYVRDWRLACAARLLRESDASLAVIARQIGYSTEFAFAGAFRRAFGVSPGRFRQLDKAPQQQSS
ncbi:AraC family transcriptional regulator [Streptomyces shenzhenensis]